MTGSGEASGVTFGQAMVGTGGILLGRNADGGPGDGMEGGGGVDGWDNSRDGLNRWEDTASNAILQTEPNAPLANATGLELHHMIINMLQGHGAGESIRYS